MYGGSPREWGRDGGDEGTGHKQYPALKGPGWQRILFGHGGQTVGVTGDTDTSVSRVEVPRCVGKEREENDMGRRWGLWAGIGCGSVRPGRRGVTKGVTEHREEAERMGSGVSGSRSPGSKSTFTVGEGDGK